MLNKNSSRRFSGKGWRANTRSPVPLRKAPRLDGRVMKKGITKIRKKSAR